MANNSGENSGDHHPGSQNLKPWPKGTSGNPRGRPEGSGIRQWLHKIADEIEPGEKRTRGHILAEKLWALASEGNSKALDIVVDGVDGRLPISSELKHSGFEDLADRLARALEKPKDAGSGGSSNKNL